MKTRVFATGLTWALALALWGVGCGQQDPAQQAANIVEQEGEELGQAASTGAAAQAAENIEAAGNEFADQVQRQGAGKVADDAARDAGQRIQNAADVAEETYDEQRAAGTPPLDAAGDAYDAVEQAHDKTDP